MAESIKDIASTLYNVHFRYAKDFAELMASFVSSLCDQMQQRLKQQLDLNQQAQTTQATAPKTFRRIPIFTEKLAAEKDAQLAKDIDDMPRNSPRLG